MAYHELIKSFHRIRPYIRRFYVYGFWHRMEYEEKSARSYDNERRRVESWLGEYMRFGQDAEGKRVFLCVDSRMMKQNPLYRAFQTKSFTDLDITLHFLLLDVLETDAGKPLREILDELEISLAEFESAALPDESSVRKKLSEYEQLGLVRKTRLGKQTLYFRSEDTELPQVWKDALPFFGEAAPLGVIGSFLQNREEAEHQDFRFKHHYILNALDSEILCALFQCMGEGRCAVIELNACKIEVLPLKIYISTQTGRQYVLARAFGRFRMFRLDAIQAVKPGEKREESPELALELEAFEKKLWGTGIGKGEKTEHVEMVIHAEPEEDFVVRRLQREKRWGNVTELGSGDWKFTADVFDALEMLPWIRTFVGRITSLHSSNPEVERRFREDMDAMRRIYGGETDAVP